MKLLCPGCESAMQVLTSGKVEVDRCFMCGGLWLDKGELGKLTERPLTPGPRARKSRRRCVKCQTGLSEVRVEQVHMDVCGSCGGVYLDDGELNELAKRNVALTRKLAEEELDPELSFRCPGCGDRYDIRKGLATSRGLSCGPCYGRVGDSLGSTSSVNPGYCIGESDYGFDRGGTVAAEADGVAAGVADALLPYGGLVYLGVRFLMTMNDTGDDAPDDTDEVGRKFADD